MGVVIPLSVILAGCVGTQSSLPTPSPLVFVTPTPSPNVEDATLCQVNQLSAQVEFEGAAGSTYGTFTLSNTSVQDCAIVGENMIQLQYSSDINNIKVNPDQNTTRERYQLPAGQSLYAHVRMPNGPQCNSEPKQVPVKYHYTIGNGQTLFFTDSSGTDTFLLTACSSPNDITQIEMSSLSDQPLSQ